MGFLKKFINVSKKTISSIVNERSNHQKEQISKKEQEHHQLAEKVSSILNYTKKYLDRFTNIIISLENETVSSVKKISAIDIHTLPRDSKKEYKKNKELAETNLKYMYLAKDYFVYINRINNEIGLSDKEYNYIISFFPFFDGKKVLDMDLNDYYEDMDTSVLGAFKMVGNTLKNAFISSPKYMDFEIYLLKYKNEIESLTIPNILNEINDLKDSSIPITNNNATSQYTQSVCPNCQTLVNENTKFCPECGQKIEVQKKKFCTECGAVLSDGCKFCSECGHKIL